MWVYLLISITEESEKESWLGVGLMVQGQRDKTSGITDICIPCLVYRWTIQCKICLCDCRNILQLIFTRFSWTVIGLDIFYFIPDWKWNWARQYTTTLFFEFFPAILSFTRSETSQGHSTADHISHTNAPGKWIFQLNTPPRLFWIAYIGQKSHYPPANHHAIHL